MCIRNNNDFVLLLTLILGVLVAFHSRIYLGGHVIVGPEPYSYSQEARIDELVPMPSWTR